MKKLLPLTLLLATSLSVPAFAHDKEDMNAWINQLFREADTDGNGTISKDEYLDYAEKQFDKMDANDDGELTKAEVLAYKKNKMKKHPMKHASNGGYSHQSTSSTDNTSTTTEVMTPNHATHEDVVDQDRVDTSRDSKSNSLNGSDNGQ